MGILSPRYWVVGLIHIVLLLGATHAKDTQSITTSVHIDHQWLSSFFTDDGDTAYAHGQVGFAHLKLAGQYSINQFVFEGAADGVFMNLYGPNSDIGLSIGGETLREPRRQTQIWIPRTAAMTYRSAVGQFTCGLATAQWGEGMLINDGGERGRFGRVVSTNTSAQCRFATRLNPKIVAFLAAGQVYRDDQAQWILGDRAFIGTAGIKLQLNRGSVGLITALRHQQDRADPYNPGVSATSLDSVVTDITWQSQFNVMGQDVHGRGEVAMIAGQTTRPYLEETYSSGADILAWGGMTGFGTTFDTLHTDLEVGYASGDNDPADNVVRSFSFHSSYGVGLILVDHVLPMLSARAVDRINDKGLLDVTPPGLRFTVNQGAVTALSYVKPKLTWTLGHTFHIDAQYIYFMNTADLVDLYQTQLNGGFNANYGGDQPGSRSLGHEIDMRLTHLVKYSAGSTQTAEFSTFIEGGVLIPGDGIRTVINEAIFAGIIGMKAGFK